VFIDGMGEQWINGTGENPKGIDEEFRFLLISSIFFDFIELASSVPLVQIN